MEGKRIVRRPVPNSARTKPPSNGLEGATSSKPIDRSTLPKDRLLYAQSQTIRSRGTKTRKWSKRASIPEHTHVHTYTRDILDPGSVVERDQKRDQRFGKGTRPAKGYRAHAVRDTNTRCRVFPLVVGHRPTQPDTASPAVYVPDYITATMLRSPSLISGKPIATLYVTFRYA